MKSYIGELKKFTLDNLEMSSGKIAEEFLKKFKGSDYRLPNHNSCSRRVREIKNRISSEGISSFLSSEVEVKVKEIEVVDILKKKEIDKAKIISYLSKKPYTIDNLAFLLKEPIEYVRYILDEIKGERYNLVEMDDSIGLETAARTGGFHKIDLSKFNNQIYRIGAVADNHLNSKFERLDVLHSIYDIFEKEGIKEVYNGGNWIEGDSRFNRYEVKNRGAGKQVDYFLQNYPQRKGIITYYVAGDDHEGWYWQREGLNIGEYAEMKARKIGREDLVYLGYVEADVELQAKKGSSIMKIMHAGGGSAYAVSYSPQKMIESFQGGEKPQILLLGHYHKADYFCYRDVHCVQLGCTQNQSTFMRKKKIQAHVGGWILEFQQAEDGSINRFKAEYLSFFNEQFYDRNQYYI